MAGACWDGPVPRNRSSDVCTRRKSSKKLPRILKLRATCAHGQCCEALSWHLHSVVKLVDLDGVARAVFLKRVCEHSDGTVKLVLGVSEWHNDAGRGWDEVQQRGWDRLASR